MGTAQSEKASSSKEAQHEGQEVSDPTHNRRKQMDPELLQTKAQAEKDLILRTISEIHQNEEKENLYPTLFLKMETLSKNFTQLLLLEKSCPRGWETLVRKSWHQYGPEEKGHLIESQDLFSPSPGTQEEPQLVILYGAAGTGKSSLARHVSRAWGQGRLYRDRFQQVFFFSCRELAQCQQLSLAELIAQGQTVPTAPIRQILAQPEKLLFILDGIDEPAWVLEGQNPELCLHWSQTQPVHMLLGSLLGKSVLPGASFLLTARTTALQRLIPSLRRPRWVEVLGFSESGRKEYFNKYFPKKRKAIQAFSLVQSDPVLSTLCLVPWVSWLVCTCLSQQMEQGGHLSLTSQTTTTLCLKYLSQSIQGQHLETQLRALCSVAAEGICRRRTLFSESDLRKQGLAQADMATFLKIGVLQQQPGSLSCSFAHLCLQEFFAAMACVFRDAVERCGDIEKDRIVETLIEVYGIHALFEAPTIHFLFGLLSEQGVNAMKTVFNSQLPLLTPWELLGKARALPQHQHLCSLGLFHCLYEIQNKKFVTQVIHSVLSKRVHDPTFMTHTVFQTNVRHLVIQTNVELLVVTFCIKFCRYVKRLQLNRDGQQGPTLNAPTLVLSRWTPTTNASWFILFSNIIYNKSLKELDLSGNPLSHSAVKSLCCTLRHPGCHLRALWLVKCGLTSSHCLTLASALRNCSRLAELDLQLNDLGDDGVRLLCEVLRKPFCNLSILW
ncbi:NACHT, LRR and PYD domains-containing protein 1a-like [Psammomys obesus]|uniref:NACHT, LRR and PYD domains-containing protein 1a-like n=1 Tax=Psammomys obesus TaxID=48139 RepID=UPI00245359D1|nr:NACHT, LRR and PYD domains-containing protein 1a-like [Psammomys obesus]